MEGVIKEGIIKEGVVGNYSEVITSLRSEIVEIKS